MQLSICIPTYNRAKLLKECLDSVINQVKGKEQVEIVICDNASPDDTENIVKGYIGNYPFMKYFRNNQNLGYVKNQLKCFKNAQGQYLAILCDDDLYLDGEVDKILQVVSEKEYAFIALNYYGFISDPKKTVKTNFAPEKDMVFKRAYDVMNYPSVGHFSGFVFNTKLAKEAIKKSLSKQTNEYYEKNRGIISDIAIRVNLETNLPAYFIGQRKLAARMPEIVDYESLYHICIDYYEYFYDLHTEGLITDSDLDYRARFTLANLPRAIVTNIPHLNEKEIKNVTEKLIKYFNGYNKFNSKCLPLLMAGRYYPVKILYLIIYKTWRIIKHIKRRFKI